MSSMLVASYPFSVSAAKAALRIAGSRDRSSRPTLRWRSFDSGSLLCLAPMRYTVSADGLSVRVRRRLLRSWRGGGFGLGLGLGGSVARGSEGVQRPPEPSSQRGGDRRRHE